MLHILIIYSYDIFSQYLNVFLATILKFSEESWHFEVENDVGDRSSVFLLEASIIM